MYARVRESLKPDFKVYIIDSVIITPNLTMILEDHGQPMYIVDDASKVKMNTKQGHIQLLL